MMMAMVSVWRAVARMKCNAEIETQIFKRKQIEAKESVMEGTVGGRWGGGLEKD